MQTESQPIRFSVTTKLIAVGVIIWLAVLLLRATIHILPPFIAAIITAYLFNPLVSWLYNKTRISKGLWIVVIYLLIFSLLYSIATWVWPRMITQYAELAAWAPSMVVELTRLFEGRETLDLGAGITLNLAPLEERLISAASDLGRTLSSNVPRLVFSALEMIIFILVYLIITFYLMLQSNQLKRWVANLIPLPYRNEVKALGHQIDRVLGAYIRGQLLLIVIMSVLLYIPLSILNVPYALVIAIASGILEIIPILGPWSAAALAMTVAFFQTDLPFGLTNVSLSILIGIIYFVLRQIEDHFIIPNLMGPLVRLHPAVVIFAVLAGGAIGGAFGLLVSIPVAAVIRILLRFIYDKLVDQPNLPLDPPTPETAKAATNDAAPASNESMASHGQQLSH